MILGGSLWAADRDTYRLMSKAARHAWRGHAHRNISLVKELFQSVPAVVRVHVSDGRG